RVKAILRRWAAGKPGAPTKALVEREDTLVAGMVSEIRSRLEPAFDLCRRRRKSGGYSADPEIIESELRELGYTRQEIAAVIRSRTVKSAAQKVVAGKTRRSPESVRAMSSRGKKYLRKQSSPAK